MRKIHVDIETYSSEPLDKVGMYRYCESFDFEILMISYAIDDGPVKIVDIAAGEKIPSEFNTAMMDPTVVKCAHNAAFERTCFRAIRYNIPIEQWRCTAVLAAYCGLPRSLGEVSVALQLGDEAKSKEGKALIRYFCMPCKPTKKNGGRMRNMYYHDPEKWVRFKNYCCQDVVSERAVDRKLSMYDLPAQDWELYVLDQEINDRGVMIDLPLVESVISIDEENTTKLMKQMRVLTGLENPNSLSQLKTWLSARLGRQVGSLTKDTIPDLLEEASRLPDPETAEEVKDLLNLRVRASNAAIKKYYAANGSYTRDGRVKGMFLYYGANRTGRWSARIMQLHNLKRNNMKGLGEARDILKNRDMDLAEMMYGDVGDVMSQLIRTTLISKPGHTLSVADFSAIEGRVIAWLAGETWAIQAFEQGRDLYVETYAQMMKVDPESVTKDQRSIGKVCVLACGYQGSIGAMKAMGGDKLGMTDAEMKQTVDTWRAANPNIVKFWKALEVTSKRAVISKKVEQTHGLQFHHDGYALKVKLPSGRELFYKGARLVDDKFGTKIKYQGTDQDTGRWGWQDTYGGKLAENITQAVARDILGEAMINLKYHGFELCMHVHDEAIAEVADHNDEAQLNEMCRIMGQVPKWAKGLPLNAEGYVTKFYKKD